jgi:hypothetical protein
MSLILIPGEQTKQSFILIASVQRLHSGKNLFFLTKSAFYSGMSPTNFQLGTICRFFAAFAFLICEQLSDLNEYRAVLKYWQITD